MNNKTIKITINQQIIETDPDQTILEAALGNNIYIPHLCSHENLHPVGACRLCVVKQAGVSQLVTSCTTKVEAGMVIDTKDEMAEKVRKLSVDLMFKTHPPECTGCPKYGKCQLQDISQSVGDTGRNLRHNTIRTTADYSNPIILHEMYRCILCGRCVRACQEMRGVGAIKFEKVNDRMQVVIDGDSLKEADCKFCGACVEVCPTGSIREHEAIKNRGTWLTREEQLVPCIHGCPAHINIPKYLRFVKEENFGAASAVVREKAPFPRVLGYICNHQCELECKRNELNEPISIRNVKRYATEQDDGSWREHTFQKPPTGKQIGIIGAGPAGLTAAYYLAKLGHEVTVYEALPEAGGMMRYGIPEYRLPRKIVDEEIQEMIHLGIKIKTNHKIHSAQALLEEGFDAVMVAMGAHQGVQLPIEGNNLKGVYINIDFLRNAAMKESIKMGKRVMVLGGGNVALDCAGAALRLGAQEVHIACLEAFEKMTAAEEEVRWAQEEGIIFHNSKTFLKIEGENDVVTGMCIASVKAFSFDSTGKAVIELVEDSEEVIQVDTVIFAVGQRPEIDESFGVTLARGNRVEVNPINGVTSIPGVFSAGDAVTGTQSVIKAIAGAREVASRIDNYLGGDGNITEHLSPEQDPSVWIGREKGFASLERAHANVEAPQVRCHNFDIMDHGLSKEATISEVSRCLQCDLRAKIEPQKFWNDYSLGGLEK